MQLFIKKSLRSGNMTLEKMNHIMKIIKSLEEPGLLIKKGVSERTNNEVKEQKGRFLKML